MGGVTSNDLLYEDQETKKRICTKCGDITDDFDGFGVLACDKCDYCSHPSYTGVICDICEEELEE